MLLLGSDLVVVKLVETPKWLAVERGGLEAEGGHVFGDLQLGDGVGVAQQVGNFDVSFRKAWPCCAISPSSLSMSMTNVALMPYCFFTMPGIR